MAENNQVYDFSGFCGSGTRAGWGGDGSSLSPVMSARIGTKQPASLLVWPVGQEGWARPGCCVSVSSPWPLSVVPPWQPSSRAARLCTWTRSLRVPTSQSRAVRSPRDLGLELAECLPRHLPLVKLSPAQPRCKEMGCGVSQVASVGSGGSAGDTGARPPPLCVL